MICKIAVTKHEVTLEGFHVRDQVELVEEHFKEPLTSHAVSCVYRSFQPCDVAILEG